MANFDSARKLRLSIHAVCQAADNGAKIVWSDEVLDALSLGGLAFFTALGAAFASGVDPQKMLILAFIAGGSQFFAILALKRGLTPKAGEQHGS